VHKSVFAGSLSTLYRGRWSYVGTSALNWHIFSFHNTSVVFISNLNQTDFERLQRCKGASPTHSSLTINPCFGHPNHLPKSGHGVFRTLYIAQKRWHPPHHTAGCQNPKDYNLEAFGLLDLFKKVEDAGQVTHVTVHSPKSYAQRTPSHNKWICDVSACLTWPCDVSACLTWPWSSLLLFVIMYVSKGILHTRRAQGAHHR
jgi:hypothetical protein